MFTPDGKFLVVAERFGPLAAQTGQLDVYAVTNDVAQAGTFSHGAGNQPFAIDFSPEGYILVAEVGDATATGSTTSSYSLSSTGALTPITAALPTHQGAACWIDGGAPAFVLEARGGADSASWGTFPVDLAKATGRRVIAYDVPGEATRDRRRARRAARRSARARRRPDRSGRGVARRAARGRIRQDNPDQIAGLVFVDPMNADFVEAVGLERVMATVPKLSAPKSDLERAAARMVEGFPNLISSLYGMRWPTNLPVVIVSAATPPIPAADLQAAWRASHAL
ncbi:MAG: hypothetical protein ABI467_21860 [Kofleriaceae bacterium]